MEVIKEFDGYLFSKLHAIGTKSEGPTYFLQQFDYKETVIIKHVYPWKEDPNIHEHLGKKVTVGGQMHPDGIVYEKIMGYTAKERVAEEKRLEIKLQLETETLWINKEPPTSQSSQYVDLTLLVRWPYRSIWQGSCPTSQIYEFLIEHEDRIIWRWGHGKIFAQCITPVNIPGGSFYEFPEIWKLDPDGIKSEGIYTARALFIASRQEVSRDFEIKFAE